MCEESIHQLLSKSGRRVTEALVNASRLHSPLDLLLRAFGPDIGASSHLDRHCGERSLVNNQVACELALVAQPQFNTKRDFAGDIPVLSGLLQRRHVVGRSMYRTALLSQLPRVVTSLAEATQFLIPNLRVLIADGAELGRGGVVTGQHSRVSVSALDDFVDRHVGPIQSVELSTGAWIPVPGG